MSEYYGSYVDENDKTITAQIFNYEHALKWQFAGGSSPGLSALHEILESYKGGKLFPTQGIGFNGNNFQIAHNEIRGIENPKQYYPERYDEYKRLKNGTTVYKRTYLISNKSGRKGGAKISENEDLKN